MRRLSEIVGADQIVDQFLDAQRRPHSDNPADDDPQQVLNDQAYFLLCWGQLESEIDDRCRSAIRRARQSRDWAKRRGWDLYNPDDKRLSGLSFEDRTALVLDRAGGQGSPYARTMLHYATRNQIAHGRLMSTRIDVLAITHEFYGIQAALS